MVSWKHYVYFKIIDKIIKDTSQRSFTVIINLLIFFDIVKNCREKSFRKFHEGELPCKFDLREGCGTFGFRMSDRSPIQA